MKGAPRKLVDGERCFPYLDKETIAHAKVFGNGNYSEGLRVAVQEKWERDQAAAAAAETAGRAGAEQGEGC